MPANTDVAREGKREPPHRGATEDQVNMRATVPQRIDRKGTKVEDAAGTGEHDSAGG